MNLTKKSDEFGFYTRESDGASGMTVTALANFCELSQSTMTQLLNRVRESDPTTNSFEDSLKYFAGKELRSAPIDNYGTMLVALDACKAVVEYFACNARKYKGRNIVRIRFAQIKSLLSYGLALDEAFKKTIIDTNDLILKADSKKSFSPKGVERKIQLRFKKELEAKVNVIVPVGYIDALTLTEVIEIKEAMCWKHAIGQVMCYSLYYPTHQKRLHLFGDTHKDFRQLVEGCCFKLNIRVTWEEDTHHEH